MKNPYKNSSLIAFDFKILLWILIFAFNLNFNASAQLIKQWDYRFGGSDLDELHDAIFITDNFTADGHGLLFAGYSQSPVGGDKIAAPKGLGDYWLVRTTTDGIKRLDKTYGGSDFDELIEVIQKNDGGYILAGWSNSGISVDKSAANFGASDYWIVSTDSSGNKLWDITIGGTSEEYLQSIKKTNDGGYIVAGRSNSGIGGNKTEPNRGQAGLNWDYWIVKISSTGTIQWDKTFGGTDDDYLFSIEQTSDGGYVLGGYSNSGVSGNKSQTSQLFSSGNGISDDYWIVKTDANGVKQWDKTFGGNNLDQLQAAIQTTDGGYLLAGGSASGANGDKSQPSQGNFDYWILKTDAVGNKLWDKRFGGSGADNLFDLIATNDGGFLLAGASNSPISGDKTENTRGGYDFWLVKIDDLGNLQLERRFGGPADDYCKSVFQLPDGNFVAAGWSNSGIGGDKTQSNLLSIDYWALKLSGSNSITTITPTSDLCSGSSFQVNYTVTGSFAAGNVFTAQLSDLFGSFVSPTDIGSISSTAGGSINAVLPLVPGSSSYQIRVVSSNPVAQNIYPSASVQILEPNNYYPDNDNDGFGDQNANPLFTCFPPAGFVFDNSDCNDNDNTVFRRPETPGFIAENATLYCEGGSGYVFDSGNLGYATSFQWILSQGLYSSDPNNVTLIPSISISIAPNTNFGMVGLCGINSCGNGDTTYLQAPFYVNQLPDAPNGVFGDSLVSACTNQIGINYYVAPINNAIGYNWTIPFGAEIVGQSDTNAVVVDYPANGSSGFVIVRGVNVCGLGEADSLSVTFEPVPGVDFCYLTVDSASQKTKLWWQKPAAAQSDSVVIARKVKGTSQFVVIATVKDTVPTSFLDTTSDPSSIEGESYQLAMKDSCGNIGEFSATATHKSIYLYGYLGWSNIPKLYWTGYVGISDPNRFYRVLRDSIGNGSFKIVKDSIPFTAPKNYTDLQGANCINCSYRVEMLCETFCSPSAKSMAVKSTSRSNIKNRTAMPFDSTLTNVFLPSNEPLKMLVTPNPAHDFLNVQFEGNAKNAQMKIFNLMGENIWKKDFPQIYSGQKISISLMDLPRGTYLLKVNDDRVIQLKKIIVE